MRSIAILAASCALLASACGGSTPPPKTTDDAPTTDAGEGHGAATPSVESEVGALPEEKVKQTFERVSGSLMKCFKAGAERLPYLSGDARFVVRVTRDGKARVAFPKESTLGDRTTEECMAKALEGTAWPKPVGGNEGVAENVFGFDSDGEERPPVAWSPEQLGAPFKHAKAALAKCRASAGNAVIKATLYVETDGHAKSIGVSSSEERGLAAIPCVVDTLNGITFPSPGSWAAKVTVGIE